MNNQTYFSYSLNERINRKSHLGNNPQRVLTLIDCMNRPDIYMQPEHLEMSGQRYLTGESKVNETRYAPYKVLFSNGDFKYRKNGYKVKFNPMFQMWQISHSNVGATVAEFKTLSEAVTYCKNG